MNVFASGIAQTSGYQQRMFAKARSPAIENQIFIRVAREFPEAWVVVISSALNDGTLDAMPDQNIQSLAEKTREFEKETMKGGHK